MLLLDFRQDRSGELAAHLAVVEGHKDESLAGPVFKGHGPCFEGLRHFFRSVVSSSVAAQPDRPFRGDVAAGNANFEEGVLGRGCEQGGAGEREDRQEKEGFQHGALDSRPKRARISMVKPDARSMPWARCASRDQVAAAPARGKDFEGAVGFPLLGMADGNARRDALLSSHHCVSNGNHFRAHGGLSNHRLEVHARVNAARSTANRRPDVVAAFLEAGADDVRGYLVDLEIFWTSGREWGHGRQVFAWNRGR